MHFEKTDSGQPIKLLWESAKELSLIGVLALVPQLSGKTLCIEDSGKLSLWDPDTREKIDGDNRNPWRGRWPPSIAMGFSADLGPEGQTETYLATDAGVFYVKTDRGKIHVEAVDLPGFYGPAASISRRNWKGTAFLWVTNLRGTIYSFQKNREGLWEPLRFHQESSRVALSTTVILENQSLMLIHVCRTREIIATTYSDDKPKKPKPIELLRNPGSEALPLPDLHGSQGVYPTQGEWCDWDASSQYLSYIEASTDDEGFLAEFLSGPETIPLAATTLGKPALPEELRKNLFLLVDSLVGCINRRCRDDADLHTELSLALIRWLRQLEDTFPEADQGARTVFSEAIHRARKWSLFGNAYSQQRDLRGPLRALAAPEGHEHLYDMELFVYRALLFSRHISTDSEQVVAPGDPSVPWGLALLESKGSETVFLGSSWGGRSVLAHQARISSLDRGEQWSLVTPDWAQTGPEADPFFCALYPNPKIPDDFPNTQWHSRSLILVEDATATKDSVLMLDAPAHLGPAEAQEFFRLTRFRFASEGATYEQLPSPERFGKTESVFSLHQLSKGLVFAGLAGSEGRAQFKLLRICKDYAISTLKGCLLPTEDGDRKWEKVISLTAAYPELDKGERNPIWSAALLEEDNSNGKYTIVIGCSDGQILRLALTVDGMTYECSPTQVGRLGTAVRALECRMTRSNRLRVFAGGADGTLIALEEARGELRFDSLWATNEQSPIARIHRLTLQDGLESAVLAVTRQGRLTLFSDVEMVEPRPGEQSDKEATSNPRFLRIPGERLGRFDLKDSVFASQKLSLRGGDSSHTPFCSLALATGAGAIRIATLHLPKRTRVRREEFKKLWKLWHAIVENDSLDNCRLPGALAFSVPSLTAAPVRLLLPSEKSSEEKENLPDEKRVPWQLQPLRKLAKELTNLSEPANNSPSPLRESLLQSLKYAYQLRDFELFKAIVRVSLRYVNARLYRWKHDEADISWYSELADCLTEVKSLWVGDPEDSDIRARIVIMKEWIAPSTYVALANLLEIKPDEADVAIQKHVKLIHEVFETGNARVALETLRALDFALTKARSSLPQRTDKESPLLRRLFQAIGAFASRAVHGTQGENGLAVSHEIARLYALGLHCAPSAAVALAHRMSEADLPDEFGAKVVNQFTLLSTLLYKTGAPPTLDKAEKLFKENFGLGKEKDVTADNPTDWNATLLERGKDFREILQWITNTTDQMLRNPENVQLFEIKEILARLKEHHPLDEKLGTETKKDDPFRHSANFWRSALEELTQKVSSSDLRTEAANSNSNVANLIPRSIRPSLVLNSTAMVEWCKDQIVRLDQMKESYKIFDPQRRQYKEALQGLRIAAEGLRTGAALQRNVVLGVLGHGLLENLDYHLLALWEVAQSLDPIQTWNWRPESEPGADQSTSGAFAVTVLSAIGRAEVSTRTLRNIQNLLMQRLTAKRDMTVEDLAQNSPEDISTWLPPSPEQRTKKWKFSDSAVAALHFAFRELRQNEKEYNNIRPGLLEIHQTSREERVCLKINFFPPDDDLVRKRLAEIKEFDMEQPAGLNPVGRGHSHGLGLYLSKLALAAVGWSFQIEYEKNSNTLAFKMEEADGKALASGDS
ncbi:MAG: hypothetical protein WAM82_04840 [Thermoanaerobaculia bacterium]